MGTFCNDSRVEHGDINWYKYSIFSEESKDVLLWLESQVRISHLERGQVLYREGDTLRGVYFLMKGVVKIYQTGVDGKEQIIRFAQKGDFIGFRSVMNEESTCSSAKVFDDGKILFISSKSLEALLEKSHSFAKAFIKMACRELKEANKYITYIAQKSVRERIAVALLMLKDSFGLDGRQVLKVVLTREELANFVGTATESVIRVISEFKDDGIIIREGRKIRFGDEQKLKRIAKIV